MVDDNARTLTKYLNGQGIDNKLRVQTGSNASYFLADHLGSTNGLTDSSGNLTASTNYDAFGNATNANFPTSYQFTGREHDNFTGLHYYRARFYDANLGRFISEDPIGFAGGDINLYGYVWNNPQHFTDPMGLDGWGNDTADWLDERIDYARGQYQYSDQDWFANGVNDTVRDVAKGTADLLRVGSGTGNAIYGDDNGYGRAANVAMDISRGAAIFGMFASPAARFTGTSGTIACATDPYRFSSLSNRWHGPDGRFIKSPTAEQMRAWGRSNGWSNNKTTGAGFESWTDANGVVRMKIKPASTNPGLKPNRSHLKNSLINFTDGKT